MRAREGRKRKRERVRRGCPFPSSVERLTSIGKTLSALHDVPTYPEGLSKPASFDTLPFLYSTDESGSRCALLRPGSRLPHDQDPSATRTIRILL